VSQAASRTGQKWRNKGFALFTALLVVVFLAFRPAFAAPTSAAIVIDAASGQVLLQSNADAQTYPASLTKMMTLYLLFEALQKGKVTLDQPLPISVYASSMPATNLALTAGDTITVRLAIQGMVIRSANDAAVVVAEALAGSVDAFAVKMNAKAAALGMTRTVFRNPNGLPDAYQHTTARDIATLALALHRDFPQFYSYFTQVRFTYRGRVYLTHNRFMLHYPGADGLKTGFINRSGYNLAASAVQKGRRLVAVIMGGRSPSLRDAAMWSLLDQGFGTATPKSQNNSLLLASAGNADILPILRPGDYSEGDSDATDATDATDEGDNSDSNFTAMSPQIAGLPTGTPSVSATHTGSTVQTAALPPAAPAAPALPPVTSTSAKTTSATTAFSPQIPILPAGSEDSYSYNPTLAAFKVPMLRPGSAELPGVSDGVMAVAVETKRFWGVQVGAYSRYTPARLAAEKAQQNLPFQIKDTHIAVDEADGHSGKLYRARLVGLAQDEANNACRELRARQIPCLVVQANSTVAMVPAQ
jgi:D-alanyl-D-alanine carboxypeptidase